ncbi:GNAT family N-acetyltransferase [Streptomyces sp. NPDC020799]|uniref:GNAT family N-acetyltransferase n=1 Tax=Streptomyces sp. NPDC020799 TaxID=3365091 RepID=UPI00378CBC08
MSTPHILLKGTDLALAMPRREMLPAYHRWENDPTTLIGFGNRFPHALEVRESGWDRQRSNACFHQFELLRLSDQTPVGMTTLEINTFNRTAEYVVVIATDQRGKGHATEATRLTLDWAFHVGALRMVWLKVLAPNTAGVTAYEKADFKAAGRLRESGYWLGEPADEILMDALRSDFPGPSAVRASG